MGASQCLCIKLDPIKTADLITMGGIFVNAILAVWVVYNLQKNQKNARILKDHFINEAKELRSAYAEFFFGLYNGTIQAKTVIPWFKLMDIKVNDLMGLLRKKYKVDIDFLLPYQNELNARVTGNPDYSAYFNLPQSIIFSESSKNSFMRFEQKNNHLFNDLIVKINDA